MSKKQDPKARIGELASILQISHRKTKDEEAPAASSPDFSASVKRPLVKPEVENEGLPPSPAPSKGPKGKSSDKTNFKYKGLYLRKVTQKQVKRRLEDLELSPDFSELVETLLVKWLEETS